MSIRKLRAGRVPNVEASQWVGDKGTIFYNETTGTLRISDGSTVGGNPLQLVASDFAFSFGDFIATTPANGHATLSSKDTDQSVDIVSNGTGEINLTGQLNVFDAEGAFGDQPIFRVKGDGQIRMLVPLADMTTGALEIVGNTSGVSFPPNQTGVILHVTGNTGLISRNYFDAVNNYGLIAGRRYNNTQPAPRRVLNNEVMFRLVGQAAGAVDNSTNADFQAYGPVRISFIANEDQTPTAQGGRLQFEITKNGTVADVGGTNTITVASMDAQNGLTATKFNGPLTGDVTGNVSGTAGSVAAANLTGTTLASNVVTSSLTTVGTLGSLAVTNTITAGLFDGKTKRNVRDAGTIADGGTVTINFLTDDVVLFVWGNGVNLAYSNYTAGRIVKVIARKATATGTDQFSLNGITAANTSSGSTTFNGVADQSYFIELTCTSTSIGSVYAKL